MARPRHESANQRKARFEQFEQRLVMSAQGVASLLPELDIAAPAITQQEVALPMVNTTSSGSFALSGNLSPTTQAAEIGAQYGFDGAGQTVAVIDSGIAWDHYALGGGFGEGHKVVGGWDFAENDANPYDDGPAGFHGTHVSGIIGSNDAQYKGVASGADLVGLRVFNDQGAGNLQWVEQALQWVHDHRNDFANPITTVNLSLGTEWNAFNTPDWANLEEEFAQLASDGMFISVAAGNSFKTYGETGLSYPAVSSHVTPIASHGADGSLSDFSQRAENVLVAPGESIKSTVPDHLFGGSLHNRFLGATGTSMAAPYVAGASALLRQANDFMGTANINQELLYQQFRETADQIYDSVTDGYFYRINLEAALAAVVTDLHGDTAATATNLGSIAQIEQITGTIGKLNDVDQFSFTAESDGQVTLHLNTTHNLDPLMEFFGTDAEFVGNEVRFDVAAGQQYRFSVATAQGSGHYTMDVEFAATETAAVATTVDWGQIVSQEFTGQAVEGETTYQMQASRDGFLTIQGTGTDVSGATFEIYDQNMNRIAAQTATDNSIQLSVTAEKGQVYFLKASGSSGSADFHVENLVSLDSGVLSVFGTDQADVISVDASNGFSVNVNGSKYHFDAAEIQDVQIVGGGGQDTLNLQLGSQNDRVTTTPDGVTVKNGQYSLHSTGTQNITVNGGGGYDEIKMNDSAGDDLFRADPFSATLSGNGYSSTATGFERVLAEASGGEDRAELTGSEQQDYLYSRDGNQTLFAGGKMIVADQFESVTVDGAGGFDQASLSGTTGNDRFELRPQSATVTSASSQTNIQGFETIYATGNRGSDTLELTDSAGSDRLRFDRSYTTLVGEGYNIWAFGFSEVTAISVGGIDSADIFDTTGNDTFTSSGDTTQLNSRHVSFTTHGFENVTVTSRYGGFDTSSLAGSTGDDQLAVDHDSVTLIDSNGNSRRVQGFDKHAIDLGAGVDQVDLRGNQSAEVLRVGQSRTEYQTTSQKIEIKNAEQTHYEGNGGLDRVIFEEFESRDLLSSLGDKATAYFKNQTVTAEDFAVMEARSVDQAIAEYDLEAVDYLYMLRGQWERKAK